jgi:hypothetical protein
MKKKIASEIVIGIILLIAIAVGGVFWLQNKTQAPAQQPVVTVPVAQAPVTQPAATQQVTQPVVTVPVADWHTYADATLGYQITFPETWKGYKSESSEVTGDLTNVDNNPDKKMGFLGDSFGKWKDTDMWTFGIVEGSKSNYQQALKKNSAYLVYLGDDKKGNALYCSGACCVAGATTKVLDFGSDSFGKTRCDETPAILKTFKFTN